MDFSVKLRFSKDSRLETFFCYALHQKVEHMLLVTSFGSSETQPEVCEYNTQLDKLIIPFYNLFAAECIDNRYTMNSIISLKRCNEIFFSRSKKEIVTWDWFISQYLGSFCSISLQNFEKKFTTFLLKYGC